MSSYNENDDALDAGEPGFFRRYGVVLALCLLAGGGIAWWLISTASGPKPPPHKPQEFSMVRVALPPPPPPPPPPQKPEEIQRVDPQEQQMIEQEPVAEDEPKPVETPQPAGDDAAPMGTNIQGDGPPDGFGLTGRGGGGIIGGTGSGSGSGRGQGSSRWGWYAVQVQNTIVGALGKNPKTRATAMDIHARIWLDAAGRVERAQLVTSTGDHEIDAAIRDEVLTGLTLREPPPADMPNPIVLRLTGSRP